MSSLAEIFSIGAVMPFLGALTSPEKVFNSSSAQPIVRILKITSPTDILLPMTIIFVIAAIISGALRLFVLRVSTKLSFSAGIDLGVTIFRKTLCQPYLIHTQRNSSVIIDGVTNKVTSVIGSINNITIVFTSLIIIVCILSTLFLIDPLITCLTFGFFGFIYFLLIKLNSKHLLNNSNVISKESVDLIRTLQESLGGIRDILIDGTQDVYCEIYRLSNQRLRNAQEKSIFISSGPRFIMEVVGILLIVLLAYALIQQNANIENYLPIFGLLVLASQRLLPTFHQTYAAWSNIKAYHSSLCDALELLNQSLPRHYINSTKFKALPFRQFIRLKKISFAYSLKSPRVLKNVSLTIKKGSRIGFVGKTGSGKSTLIDIVMGLLTPTTGSIEVDGQVINSSNMIAWQRHIAHVPQNIFLIDGSIEENIAFGVSQDAIDSDRVMLAARKAQLNDLVESLPEKYKTFVGERGVRLSGGQRQRIGIARALYKQADILILDEATSALDSKTEEAVMESIQGLSKDLTILIIAHRLSTLKECTQIVEVEDVGIKYVGNYLELMGANI